MSAAAYEDDSDLTEIIIQPDGRIYAFGLSAEVSQVLDSCKSAPVQADVVVDSEGSEAVASVNGRTA